MIRVFVSSVSKGLEKTRQQVLHDLRKASFDVGAMEQFGAQAEMPLEVCLREVRKADVMILIIGPRYGSLLPQGISFTQAEFREARGAGIPILAIRVPDSPEVSEAEGVQLEAFITEVGGSTTFDSLGPNESLERVSAKVLTALAVAKDQGRLGSRFSLFQTYTRYFAEQLKGNSVIFNHSGLFLGRSIELRRLLDFLLGKELLLLVKAPGGSGKSRLLLEAAKAASSEASAPQILFVDPGATWTAEDINRLPVNPVVLVFDDGHRRPDIDRLIAACRQHNDQCRFIVSCRPSAIGIVRPLVSQLIAGCDIGELDLSILTKEDAEAIARDDLGTDLGQLAPSLVKLADRNPLVIRVGGRCIAEKRVPPEVLERTPEVFRALVLDRLLDDPSLKNDDEAARRRILQIIAAAGPVVSEGEEFLQKLCEIVKVPSHDARRLLAILEKAGFLLRRGRLVRVSPDVLGDHLLYRAAVDENGKPTGFVDTMISAFAPTLLQNILGNAAELDWRASVSATHEPVLAATWREMIAALPRTSNPQRAALIGQLRRAAAFAPEDVLRVLDWITDHPAAPPDRELMLWGLEDSPQQVADALIDTYGFIATHPDFTDRCVGRLWTLAVEDAGATSPHVEHSRRKLATLLKYEQGVDARVQEMAVTFIVKRLLDPMREKELRWAISTLGAALERLGEANEANHRQFTLGQFSLAFHLPQIVERRNNAIGCLRLIAMGKRPEEAVAALHELGGLLFAPRGPFGADLKPNEMSAWQPEAEKTIGILQEVATAAPVEVVRFLARRTLRETSRQHWKELVPILVQALANTPPIPSEPLYDLLAGVPWEEQMDDYDEEERRLDRVCAGLAEDFWRQHPNTKEMLGTLLAGISTLRTVAAEGHSQAGRLMRSLIAAKREHAEAIVRELAKSGEPGWQLLRPAILTINETNPSAAMSLIEELAQSGNPQIRGFALDPVQWMLDDQKVTERALTIARRLSRDPSISVRRVVAQVLRRFRTRAPSEALSILTGIAWDDDLSLTNAVLEVLHPKYGLDPARLSDEDIDALLDRIASLPGLQGRAHDILGFIAFASTRRPRKTVELLVGRVTKVDDHSGKRGDERWTPIPYNGHGLALPGLATDPEYRDLLRLIRDACLGATIMVQFWLPELYRAAVSSIPDGLAVLQEWVDSGEMKKIVGAAHLLRGFDHSIVFSSGEFVADLLDAASKAGEKCLKQARSELFSVAISGIRQGAPGQPMPRDVSDKAEALKLADVFSGRVPARDFYQMLAHQAEESIARDMLQWEEEGGDE